MGALKIWNGTSWDYAGRSTPGWRKAGVDRRVTGVALTASEFNAASVPVLLRQGYTYSVAWRGILSPNTIGMFSQLSVRLGAANAITGTFMGRDYVDHRAVSRLVTGVLETVFDWTAADLATYVNICVAPNGGSVALQADNIVTYGPATTIVNESITAS